MSEPNQTLTIPPEQLDRSLAHLKMRSPRDLFTIADSFLQRGQLTTVKIVVENGQVNPIIIDGFKRVEASIALKMPDIKAEIVASSIPEGILNSLKVSIDCGLHPFEQGKMLCHLADFCGYQGTQLAIAVGKSTAWVSHRRALATDTPACIVKAIFAGQLPPSSYSYAFAKFIRDFEPSPSQLEELVAALAGKNLNVRHIHDLCEAYFLGHPDLAEFIRQGWINKALRLIAVKTIRVKLTQLEKQLLHRLTRISDLVAQVLHFADKLNLATTSSQFRAEFESINSLLFQQLTALQNALHILGGRDETEGQS